MVKTPSRTKKTKMFAEKGKAVPQQQSGIADIIADRRFGRSFSDIDECGLMFQIGDRRFQIAVEAPFPAVFPSFSYLNPVNSGFNLRLERSIWRIEPSKSKLEHSNPGSRLQNRKLSVQFRN
jgi:hypothetical protein